MFKKYAAFLMLAGVALGSLGLGGRAALAAPETPQISIGHAFGVASTALYVAEDQKLFEKHGLTAKLIVMNEGSTILASLASGSIQFGTPTPSVLLQAVDNGLNMTIVAGTYQYPTPTNVGLLGRTDLNITKPQDLIGKKVAVAGFGGLQDMVVKKWLTDNGVDLAKVTFIETPFARMADQLKSKQVDAVTADSPVFDRIVAEKAATPVVDFRTIIPNGTLGGVMAAEKGWVAKNPQTVAAYRATLQDAIDFVNKNPEETKQIVGKHMNMPPDVTASLKVVSLLVQVKPEQMKFWDDLLLSQKMISKKVDLVSLIAP